MILYCFFSLVYSEMCLYDRSALVFRLPHTSDGCEHAHPAGGPHCYHGQLWLRRFSRFKNRYVTVYMSSVLINYTGLRAKGSLFLLSLWVYHWFCDFFCLSVKLCVPFFSFSLELRIKSRASHIVSKAIYHELQPQSLTFHVSIIS